MVSSSLEFKFHILRLGELNMALPETFTSTTTDLHKRLWNSTSLIASIKHQKPTVSTRNGNQTLHATNTSRKDSELVPEAAFLDGSNSTSGGLRERKGITDGFIFQQTFETEGEYFPCLARSPARGCETVEKSTAISDIDTDFNGCPNTNLPPLAELLWPVAECELRRWAHHWSHFWMCDNCFGNRYSCFFRRCGCCGQHEKGEG